MAASNERCPIVLPGVKLEQLPLTPSEGFVLSRVNGLAPARQIAAETGLAPADVEAALAKLEALGAIGWQSVESAAPRSKAAAAAAPRGEVKTDAAAPDMKIVLERVALTYRSLGKIDHYKLLGVPRTAGDDAIKAAYAALSREIHPDRFFKQELGAKRDMLDTVFARISEAYDVLKDPARRQAYDKSLLPAPPRGAGLPPPPAGGAKPAGPSKPSVTAGAERIVQLAEEQLRAGHYTNAITNFKLAVAMAPHDRELAARYQFVEGLQTLIGSLEKIMEKPEENESLIGAKAIDSLVARLKKDRDLFPTDDRLYMAAIKFLVHFDRDAKAAREFAERLIRRAPRAPYLVLMGRVCVREGNAAEALRFFERALGVDPSFAEAKDAIKNLKKK